LRTRTKFCALVAVLAIAAPMAVSQAPTTPAPAATSNGRLLPTTAAAYADYQGKVTAVMSNKFGSAKDLDNALETFGAPNVDQLSSSWVSYSGILAAQNPEFVKEVRNIDQYYGRERLMLGLQRDLGYAKTLKGGADAMQTVLAANSRDAARVSSAGAFVREQSYTLQKVTWGKEDMRKKKDGVVSSLRSASKTSKNVDDAVQKLFAGPDLNAMLASFAASPTGSESLWDKVQVFTASAPGKAFSSVAPVTVAQNQLTVVPEFQGTVNRMVTLGALHAIDADQSAGEQVKATMADPTTTQCLEAAQMEMFGCLSAVASRSDQAFCLARYGLRVSGEKQRSIAGCVTEIAN